MSVSSWSRSTWRASCRSTSSRRRSTGTFSDFASSRPLPGVDRVRVPGQGRLERRIERERDGVPLSTALLKQVDEVAKSLGVTPLSEPDMSAAEQASPRARRSGASRSAIYRQPGVGDACIALQDGAGVDVNLLLFLLWQASQGRTFAAAEVDDLERRIGAWRRHDGRAVARAFAAR